MRATIVVLAATIAVAVACSDMQGATLYGYQCMSNPSDACGFWKCYAERCATDAASRVASSHCSSSQSMQFFALTGRTCWGLHQNHRTMEQSVHHVLSGDMEGRLGLRIRVHNRASPAARCFYGAVESPQSLMATANNEHPHAVVEVDLHDDGDANPHFTVGVDAVADHTSAANATATFTVHDLRTNRVGQLTPFINDHTGEPVFVTSHVNADGSKATREQTRHEVGSDPHLAWMKPVFERMSAKMHKLSRADTENQLASVMSSMPMMKALWGNKCGVAGWAGALGSCAAAGAGCLGAETGIGAVICGGSGIACGSGVWCCAGGAGC